MKTKTAKNVLHKIIFLLLFFHALFLLTAFKALPQNTFQKTLSEAGSDNPKSVKQTADGGYIITGYSLFGGGIAEAYLIKLDNNGDLQWAKIYGDGTGGSLNDYGNSVQQTADGGYIVAGYSYLGAGARDVFVFKTDSAGTLQWAKTFGGSGDEWGESVQENSDGTYIVAGYTSSFPGPEANFYLLKLNTNGSLIWSKTYGGAAGYERCYSVKQTSDDGYILFGSTVASGFGAGGYDYYIVKTDSIGDTLWSKTYGGGQSDFGKFVQATNDGGYILSGFTSDASGMGGYDLGVVKILSNGNLEWAKLFGGTGGDNSYSVQQTNDDGYIIGGTTFSFGTNDTYLVKTDSSGNMQWSKNYIDNGTENELQITTDGGYIVIANASADFHFIKTDAVGNSGCNEADSTTVEAIWSASVTTPATVINNSPGTVENTYTGTLVVGNRTPSASVLCFSSCIPPAAPIVGPDTFYCEGDSAAGITAAGSNIQWYADPALTILIDTGSPFIPSPVAGTNTYYVTQTIGGCKSSANSVVIIVNPLPIITLTSSDTDTSICVGDTVTFTASPSGLINYDFFVTGTPVQSGTGNTLPYSNLTNGDSIAVLVMDSLGCIGTSNTLIFTVNTVAVILTSSDDTICLGDTVTFTASPAGYDNYIFWNGAIPLQAGATNTYTTTSLLAGNSITVTADDFASGCLSTQSNAISITVIPKPIVGFSVQFNFLTPPPTVIMSFFDSSQYATSYYWDFGDGSFDTIPNPTHSYPLDSFINYTVCLIVSNACGSDTLCKNYGCILPYANFNYTDSNLTVNFIDSSLNVINWFWDFGDGDTSTVQNPTHIYPSDGTYKVCLVVSNICGFELLDDTICKFITLSAVGIDEFSGNKTLTVYPNPTKNVINVSLSLNKPYIVKLSILNNLGQEVWSSGKKLDTGQHEINIKTHNLTKGIYFVKIHLNNKESWVGKFVKID